MVRFCHALHRRIAYSGHLCPLCHEIEINLELMHEHRHLWSGSGPDAYCVGRDQPRATTV